MTLPGRPGGAAPADDDASEPRRDEASSRPGARAAADGGPRAPSGGVADFVGEPTRDLEAWRWLWAGDRAFPLSSHRGAIGRWIVAVKRLFRPLVKAPLNDLWDRQRVFNLILLEHFAALSARAADTGARLDHVQGILQDGLDELMRHDDALYARVDLKLDRYRSEARELLATLRAALTTVAADGVEERERPVPGGPEIGAARREPLARAVADLAYVEFERRFRGTEEEIAERLAVYLPHLRGGGPLLDLGCGRGEALAVFAAAGLEARGVDLSGEMVARCRERGLAAVQGDLLGELAATPAGSLGAVVSFHVIEHLAPATVERLLGLAFAALRPGGVLVLETPNPLSLVVAARNFWLDPTHQRPLHPETLRQLALQLGFDPPEVMQLRPFPTAERLPEIPLAEVPSELRLLADRVNRLRDRLDDLLFGCQDYALVARRPGG